MELEHYRARIVRTMGGNFAAEELMARREETPQLNVLVIDDDEQIRNMLAQLITREGHQVVVAESAEEGLEYLPHWRIQVAFVDHLLPGTEGLVLSEYLRRNNPNMKIVLITGLTDARLRKRSKALSLTFLPKPFPPSAVYDVLEEYINEQAERHAQHGATTSNYFAPPIAEFADSLSEGFGMPNVPKRLRERLVLGLERSLYQLRNPAHYNEADRVRALSALLTAKLLGLDLPNTKSGHSYYREYDALMRSHGRRCEFTAPEL